ncbi:MAG TPA: hypothetical protein PKH77_00905 [Anaerolineae bacterium]|nr:hypothetical protein [Anaerolineae bacterium]
MKDEKHTHYFTPSWWVNFLFLGILNIAIAVGFFIKNYQDWIAKPWTSWEYVEGALLVCLTASGIFMFVAPFVMKIVISPQGIEYHTISYIVRLTWQNSSNEWPENWTSDKETDETITADIYVRPWARFNSLKVKRQAIKNGIPISWYGGIGGRRLKADIKEFAPHLKP